jgi:hypothetical protein
MPAAQDDKDCFFICPIGLPGSETRKRSDSVFEFVVKKALEPEGYTVQRADEIDESGLITTQIINRLVNSSLVVADLTEQNPNVLYELAVRHAFGKPYIQMIMGDERLPFDVQGVRTIRYNHFDLGSADAAKKSLCGMAANAGAGLFADSPLTYALNLQDLRQSGRPEERGIAEIIDELQDMKRVLRRVADSPTLDESFIAKNLQSIKSSLKNLARPSGPRAAFGEDHAVTRMYIHDWASSGAIDPDLLLEMAVDPRLSSEFVSWLSGPAFKAAQAGAQTSAGGRHH